MRKLPGPGLRVFPCESDQAGLETSILVDGGPLVQEGIKGLRRQVVQSLRAVDRDPGNLVDSSIPR